VSAGGGAGALDVAPDGEGELGEVGVADDAAKLPLGFKRPGGAT
jgi:hypothetical protein